MKRASSQPSHASKKMNIDPTEDEADFLFRSRFRPEQQARAIQNCLDGIHCDLECIKSHGFEEFTKRRAKETSDFDAAEDHDADGTKADENLGTAFEGTLRDYQIFMLERAKKENTIVHLGTGMGKTLISIFLIKEFLAKRRCEGAAEWKGKSQILFLVPSIALAVQHTDSLKANLPCRVETACHTSSNNARAREDIAEADVIVATHGAARDLLTHYPDILSLINVSLMVMDECHYATGEHNYATILQKFYHPLQKGSRPRILGLTASPLINVSVRTNDEQLKSLLSNFESIMDSKLVGFPRGSSSLSNVDQAVVEYRSQEAIDLPDQSNWRLHHSRKKEIKQLQHLCNEVGPKVTASYAFTLSREVSRNEFDQETPEQCQNLKKYLLHVATYLNELIAQGKAGAYGGHTDKTRKLESLLHKVLNTDDQRFGHDPVGIVFVERRITAIALCNYFWSKKNSSPADVIDVSADESETNEMQDAADVFDDAENNNNIVFGAPTRQHKKSVDGEGSKYSSGGSRPQNLRSDVAVRKATHIFKYLARKKSLNEHDQQEFEDDWVHQTTQIRRIIHKLRNRETNVLFATSVVEEGVDVEACSFVISFDSIKTVKSYIQMKGRARQKDARFFVFADASINCLPLSLQNAYHVENMVHQFISQRETEYIREFNLSSNNFTDCSIECAEERAMHREEYKTSMSSVDLSSSKSLLNRYSLAVPIDPSCRTSKQAISLHMPLYKENSLTLPTHIPPKMRVINLPSLFHGKPVKKKHSLMALAACVRLHKLGLLNDRLLPLSDTDMKSWLIEHALGELPRCKVLPSYEHKNPCTVYLYKIVQHGKIFHEEEMLLSSNRTLTLAFVSLSPLPDNLPSVSYCHSELGDIECNLSYVSSEQLTQDEWARLTDFHSVLFNARWRRKSKSRWFAFDDDLLSERNHPYAIACLLGDDKISWECIDATIDDFSRSVDERKHAVQKYDGNLVSPRVCCPTYSPNTSYIVYGSSGKTCRDEFATCEFKTFEEYYESKYCIKVSPNGQMYKARRIWDFPQSSHGSVTMSVKEIPFIDLPQELCAEAIVADPLLMLHSVVLPQVLYKLEHFLTTNSFIQHATSNYPALGKCLSTLPIKAVTEALTAKSCSEPISYDRLEWLGDGVLKLIHTNALLKWKRTSFLHEGYLSLLRSAMGSNERLHNCAEITGIDKFILLRPMSRGEWQPCGLKVLMKPEDIGDDLLHLNAPSHKVCADVVEALIGLIFLYHGIEDANSVACELGISFNYGDADETDNRAWTELSVHPTLVDFVSSFLGVQGFHSPYLLVEATTHQSCLHKPVPSYQRLEWIGDAVLCLAIREWLFRLDDSLTVPRLVVFETTLECNESLAFLGMKKGLCQFIDHRDSRLPSRFETFQRDLTIGLGLWCTDPPKVIPDVVEALIGMAHVDLGFEAGQKAALHVIRPILHSIHSLSLSSPNSMKGILHPKQHLYEITGGIVRVRAHKWERFLRLGLSCLSVEHKQDRGGYVGVVSCKGIIISTVLESSSRAAINVASSLAVELLMSNPPVLAKLRDIHLISTRCS